MISNVLNNTKIKNTPTKDNYNFLVQRKCKCGAESKLSGQCDECEKDKLLGVQTKLRVGVANDVYEQEADRVADQVLGMSSHSNISRAPLPIQRFTGRSHEKSIGNLDTTTTTENVDRVLGRSGNPLKPKLRHEMEQRFGYDFSQVRIHTDAIAEQSARDVNAYAYTAGHNVVFGAGQFSPGTRTGKRLLAHELTHVVQQRENNDRRFIQRAEVDDRSCAGLLDIESDIDTKVNAGIADARKAAAKPMVVADFLKDVSSRLGGTLMGAIEIFIKNMSSKKRTSPPKDLTGTKFSGVSSVNKFFKLHTLGVADVVGPAANVKGICVGADKLGHFFGEGFTYFQVAKLSGGGKAGTDAAVKTGRFLEISAIQGLGVTGVFSNADLAANLAGKKFYEDLEANPTGFTFKIANYITKKWNETVNPSFFASAEAGVVWSNLLSGKWDGAFTSAGGTSSATDAKVILNATTAGNVTGVNEWPKGASKPNKEKIKNGKITQRTTKVSGVDPRSGTAHSATPVSGVTIDFDWELKSSSGKGKWQSTDEQNLKGTWGIGSSTTNGGAWKLKKA